MFSIHIVSVIQITKVEVNTRNRIDLPITNCVVKTCRSQPENSDQISLYFVVVYIG